MAKVALSYYLSRFYQGWPVRLMNEEKTSQCNKDERTKCYLKMYVLFFFKDATASVKWTIKLSFNKKNVKNCGNVAKKSNKMTIIKKFAITYCFLLNRTLFKNKIICYT